MNKLICHLREFVRRGNYRRWHPPRETLGRVMFFLLLQLTWPLVAATPTLIPFQGRLTDQAGKPYINGQYTITFTLYPLAVGGEAIWTETHERVGVVNGMVNVFLGSISPLDGVSFAETRHLGITIDADNNRNTPDPEMVPRQMIIPAFWAKQADNANKLEGSSWGVILAGGSTNPVTGRLDGTKIADNTISQSQIAEGQVVTRNLANAAVTAEKLAVGVIGTLSLSDGAVTSTKIADGTIALSDLSAALLNYLVPAGTIVSFGGNGATPPPGWLFCNGDAFPASQYPNLFAAIGTSWGTAGPNNFRLPDLRGVFLRGKNAGRNDAFADPDSGPNFRANPWGGNAGDAVGSYQTDELRSHTHSTARVNGGPNYKSAGGDPRVNEGTSSPAGGNETRPKNAYVNYLIKY